MFILLVRYHLSLKELTFGVQNGLKLHYVPVIQQLQIADLSECCDWELHSIEQFQRLPHLSH